MRILLLAIIGTLAAIGCAGAAEPTLECPPGTHRWDNAGGAGCETPGGVSEGPIEGRYANGSLRYSGTVRHGRTQGLWTQWSASGKVQIEANYEDGELVGRFRRFDSNGVLQSEGNHDRAGEMDGKWTEYWPNGRTRIEWGMRHGEQRGPVTTWYESGAKKSEGQRADGRPDGVWRYFAEDGRETKRCRYQQGQVLAGPCGEPGPE